MSDSEKKTAYDRLPYPIYTFPATHPARLAAQARLFNCPAVDPKKARVLELGCAQGVNLMAMAQVLPEAEFIGVDASASQISKGEEIRQSVGLSNVRLIAADLVDWNEDVGHFDYIIAHGLFSWVPKHVQEAILQICQDRLTPNGVAYISYNCLPGWRMRGALRDMMLLHTESINDQAEKVAQSKALIKFLAEACPEDSAYGKYLRGELELIAACDDGYLAHDFLEEENEPFYITHFVKGAMEHGLQYLGDADASTMLLDGLPEPAAETLRSLKLPQVATEQYMDFVRNRMFRSTLLCRQGVAIDRDIGPARLDDLCVSPFLSLKRGPTPQEPTALFVGPGNVDITIGGPAMIFMFTTLAARGLHPFPCRELVDQTVASQAEDVIAQNGGKEKLAENLKIHLLQSYFKKIIDLTVGPFSYREINGTNPEAMPLARWQAAQGLPVSMSTLTLTPIDPFTRKEIALCDGSRDFDELVNALFASSAQKDFELLEADKPITDPDRQRAAITQLVPFSLKRLADAGIVQQSAVAAAVEAAQKATAVQASSA
jgi:methyltransferase-like protein/trans-aconitate methyltransferase